MYIKRFWSISFEEKPLPKMISSEADLIDIARTRLGDAASSTVSSKVVSIFLDLDSKNFFNTTKKYANVTFSIVSLSGVQSWAYENYILADDRSVPVLLNLQTIEILYDEWIASGNSGTAQTFINTLPESQIYTGWTPILVQVPLTGKTVLKLQTFVGGEGDLPNSLQTKIGKYKKADGTFTDNLELAIDITADVKTVVQLNTDTVEELSVEADNDRLGALAAKLAAENARDVAIAKANESASNAASIKIARLLFNRYSEFDSTWDTRALGIEDIKVYTNNTDVRYYVSIIRAYSTVTTVLFRLTEYNITTNVLLSNTIVINKSEVASASAVITKKFTTSYSAVEVTLDFSKITVAWNNASDLNPTEMLLNVSLSRHFKLAELSNVLSNNSTNKYASEYVSNLLAKFLKQSYDGGLLESTITIVANSATQTFNVDFKLMNGGLYNLKQTAMSDSTNFSLQVYGVKNGIQGARLLLIYKGYGESQFTSDDDYDTVRLMFGSLTNASNASYSFNLNLISQAIKKTELSQNITGTATDIAVSESALAEVNRKLKAKSFFNRYAEFDSTWDTRASGIEDIKIYTNNDEVRYYVSIIRAYSTVTTVLFRLTEYNATTNTLISNSIVVNKSEVASASAVITKKFTTSYSVVEFTLDFSKITVAWNNTSDLNPTEMLLSISRNRHFKLAELINLLTDNSMSKYSSGYVSNLLYRYLKQNYDGGLLASTITLVASSATQTFNVDFKLMNGGVYNLKQTAMTDSTNFSLQVYGVKNGIQGARLLLIYKGYGESQFTSDDDYDTVRLMFGSLTNASNASYSFNLNLISQAIKKTELSQNTTGTATDIAVSESALAEVNRKLKAKDLFNRYSEFNATWDTRASGIEDIKVYTNNTDVRYYISIIRSYATSTTTLFRLTEYNATTNTLISNSIVVNKSEVASSSAIITKRFTTSYSMVEVTLDFSKITVAWNNSADMNPTEMLLNVSLSRHFKAFNLNDNIFPSLPKALPIVIGRRLEIFKCGVVNAINPDNYAFEPVITSGTKKGNFYDSVYIYDAVGGDSQFSLKFLLKNDNYIQIAESEVCDIVPVIKKTNPATKKNVLMIGDSFTDIDYFPMELRRMLTGLGGIVSSPVSDNFTNINFIGTRNRDGMSYSFKREGWSGKHYSWFQTSESPFWNPSTSVIDFDYYMSNLISTNGVEQNLTSGDKIDIAIIMLGTNEKSSDSVISSFWQKLIDHNSNIKILVAGMIMPAPYGGTGSPAAINNQTYWGMANGAMKYNRRVEALSLTAPFVSNVKFVDVMPLVDILHNMPKTTVYANQRNSVDTVTRGTDNVHPASSGMYQIADAFYNAFHYYVL